MNFPWSMIIELLVSNKSQWYCSVVGFMKDDINQQPSLSIPIQQKVRDCSRAQETLACSNQHSNIVSLVGFTTPHEGVEKKIKTKMTWVWPPCWPDRLTYVTLMSRFSVVTKQLPKRHVQKNFAHQLWKSSFVFAKKRWSCSFVRAVICNEAREQ